MFLLKIEEYKYFLSTRRNAYILGTDFECIELVFTKMCITMAGYAHITTFKWKIGINAYWSDVLAKTITVKTSLSGTYRFPGLPHIQISSE